MNTNYVTKMDNGVKVLTMRDSMAKFRDNGFETYANIMSNIIGKAIEMCEVEASKICKPLR